MSFAQASTATVIAGILLNFWVIAAASLSKDTQECTYAYLWKTA
jgi:hypothetical protein